MNNDNLSDRTPPQSIEAEKAVLGSIFLSKDGLGTAEEYLTSNDFYKRAHQLIFKSMEELENQGVDNAIDVVTVTNQLKADNTLEDVGGVPYITDLTNAVPTAANLSYYAKIVRNKAVARHLIETATNIASQGYQESDDVQDLIDNAEQEIMNVSESRNTSDFREIRTVLNATVDKINDLAKNGGNEVTGIPTGYPELDKMTTGFHPGELIIVAARPAVGKTAFALNIAENVALKTGDAVAIFSLEMSADSLVERMICSVGNIDANHLRTGQLTDDEWDNFMAATGELASHANIYIDDTPGERISEIRAQCRRLAKQTGNLGLIVIDYLQLIEGSNKENRQQEVADISRQLKKLAKELQVPVIALSQLSRGVEQRQDKRPVLSDIRESGSIEQDADIVSFLYRDDYYEHDEDDESGGRDPRSEGGDDDNIGEVEIIIEKNRSGPRGTVKLLFVKSYNKFSSISYADNMQK